MWDNHTVINLIDGLENGDLAIILDCGESDFFFLKVNQNLHHRLLEKRLSHDFYYPSGERITDSIGITLLTIRYFSSISFSRNKLY